MPALALKGGRLHFKFGGTALVEPVEVHQRLVDFKPCGKVFGPFGVVQQVRVKVGRGQDRLVQFRAKGHQRVGGHKTRVRGGDARQENGVGLPEFPLGLPKGGLRDLQVGIGLQHPAEEVFLAEGDFLGPQGGAGKEQGCEAA